MRSIVVTFIDFYQRYVSPYKGFCCAHASVHQGDSCSQAVRQMIIEHDLIAGYRPI